MTEPIAAGSLVRELRLRHAADPSSLERAGRPSRSKRAPPLVTVVLVVAGMAAAFMLGSMAAAMYAPNGPASPGWAGAAALAAPAPHVANPPPPPADASNGASDLGAFYDSFDKNQDNLLQVSEARAFYAWVEAHIAYRYDDENTSNPDEERIVGDGRPGRDYQQTPLETYMERLGDCEDQNGLQLAFYTHWKVPAYVAYVNARANNTIDHAITLVYAANTLQAFQALLGPVPYYEARARPGIEDGFYFLVDNTYSNVFAQISGGIGEGKFVVHRVASYEDLFGSKWTPVVPDR